MKRALPLFLFAALTIAVFWKFLLFGQTLHAVVLLEGQLGIPTQEPRPLFRSESPHGRVADNIVLLANHLRVYNDGLHHGQLRLWNPTLCCGFPIYADPMAHPFYPPQLLLHALFGPESAYEIFLLLHFFFSGVAMYALARAIGRSGPAATAAGAVWMLFGYNSMWFSTGILAGVSVWGPLALLGIARAFDRRDLAPAAAAGLSMGLAILGSHPQHALHFFIFSLGWLYALGWKKEHGWRFPLRASTVYALLPVGVGLVSILTRLETIANGYRNPGADLGMYYGDSRDLLPAIATALVGKAYFPRHPFFEYEFWIYAGLGVLTLASVAVVRLRRDRVVRFVALFAAATLAVAFLKPAALLLQILPIVNLSPPSRWLFLFGLSVSLLSAYGWDSLREKAGWTAFATLLPTALYLAILTVGAGPIHWKNGAAVETGIGFALVTLAAFVLRRSPTAAAAVGAAAILFELLPAFVLTNWHVDPAPMRRTPEAIELARSRDATPWRGTGTLGTPYSAEIVRRNPRNPSLAQPAFIQEFSDGNNLLALFGVENPAGFEAILPEHYLDFCTAAGGDRATAGRSVAFLRFESRLIDALNVKYFFLPPALKVPARFRLLKDFGAIKLYENPSALPRAWLVGRAVAARDGRDAVEKVSARDFDPRKAVVLETGEPTPAAADPVDGGVFFTRRQPDRLELKVSSRTPAYLVLSETDYPGWEAEIDGAPATIYRANVAFRALAIPPGEHAVAFRFRPPSARVGLPVSAAFALLGLGVIAAGRFRSLP